MDAGESWFIYNSAAPVYCWENNGIAGAAEGNQGFIYGL